MGELRPDVLYRLRFLSDLTLGPGGHPLFVLTEVHRPEKDGEGPPGYRRRLAIWEEGLRFLTQEEAYSPRYDGERYVYFLRRVQNIPQLFRLDLKGGEAEQLTHLKAGVEAYWPSPDGKRVAFLSRGDQEAPKRGAPRVYEALPFKFDGVGLLPEPARQVWLWSEEDRTPRRLTQRPQDVQELAWAPTGRFLVFTAPGDARERARWRARLYRLDLGEARVAEIGGGRGPIMSPLVTPDEEAVLFVGHGWERKGATQPALYRQPLSGGPARALTEALDLWIGNTVNSDARYGAYPNRLVLSPQGDAVYFTATVQGASRLICLDLTSAEARVLTPEGVNIAAFALGADRVYTLCERQVHPPVLAVGDEVLFDPNREVLGALPPPEPFRWVSPEGHTVEGWVLLPEGSGPHPLVLYIHGGPHTAYGHAFMLEFYLLRARGIAVAYANPRGSTGYGQEYADLAGRWGEVDEADLMGFLEAVLARFPVDPARVGVAGGSYGGYMTNWITARPPERFKAAVTQRSICNWTSFWGASDIGPRFTELQLEASPWEAPEVLWSKSPLRLAHQVQAPTLVVHAEEDHRCPVDQGETWFTALWERGVPVRFLRVPEEGHELSRAGRPDRRVKRLEEILAWFERYLKE